MNALRIKAGLGGDVSFTDNLYLRINAIVSLRTPSQYEKDFKSYIADLPNMYTSGGGGGGLGLTLGLGLGYRF